MIPPCLTAIILTALRDAGGRVPEVLSAADADTQEGRPGYCIQDPMHRGGFAPGFYRAYEDAWPLAEGWRERRDAYVADDVLAFMAEGDVGYGRRLDEILHHYVGYAAL